MNLEKLAESLWRKFRVLFPELPSSLPKITVYDGLSWWFFDDRDEILVSSEDLWSGELVECFMAHELAHRARYLLSLDVGSEGEEEYEADLLTAQILPESRVAELVLLGWTLADADDEVLTELYEKTADNPFWGRPEEE